MLHLKIIFLLLMAFTPFSVIQAKNGKVNATNEIAICAIFQNEGPWLKEWIEFHQMLGVSHFYLYNNKSTDDFATVLSPYIKKQIVEVLDWPGTGVSWGKTQCDAYMDCIEKNKTKSKWIAFIDIDEFLCPVKDNNLHAFLKKYTDYPAVTANWIQFGTSFIEKLPQDKLMIESLYLTAGSDPHIKSIVQPNEVVGYHSPHCFKYKNNKKAVNANFIPVEGSHDYKPCTEIIRINHYHTRDETYLREYKIPSKMARGFDWLANHENVDRLSQKPDYIILKYVPKLRKIMKMK